jgi:hypothetical protein
MNRAEIEDKFGEHLLVLEEPIDRAKVSGAVVGVRLGNRVWCGSRENLRSLIENLQAWEEQVDT